jgi:hypothetical protein
LSAVVEIEAAVTIEVNGMKRNWVDRGRDAAGITEGFALKCENGSGEKETEEKQTAQNEMLPRL